MTIPANHRRMQGARMSGGRALHAGLRRTPVQMVEADLVQPSCATCGKRISDDRLLANTGRVVRFCSNTCGAVASQRRKAGRAPHERATTRTKGHSPEQDAQRSESMKRWHENRRKAQG